MLDSPELAAGKLSAVKLKNDKKKFVERYKEQSICYKFLVIVANLEARRRQQARHSGKLN